MYNYGENDKQEQRTRILKLLYNSAYRKETKTYGNKPSFLESVVI